MVGVLNPAKYGEYFYEFYTSNTRRKLRKDRRTLSKRKSKDKKVAAMVAAAAALEGNAVAVVNPVDPPLVKDNLNFPTFPVANIDLDANASKFAVFSAIRSSVLEAETRYALFQDIEQNLCLNSPLACCLVCTGTCSLGNLADCSCHTIDQRDRYESVTSESAESDSEDIPDKEPEIVRVPLIVGAGLRSLFELIADARHMQPVLCTKALKSLLDVIQGQQPESFKLEPDDLIIPLYELLLDLATMTASGTSSVATTTVGQTKNTHTEANWSAMACAALIGLCIARGETGKILKAITALIMSPKHLGSQVIQIPAVLCSLQRTVICAALNKPIRPDFHSRGVPHNSLLDEFPLKSSAADNKSTCSQPAMATDGTYLYLLLDGALLKIGTGYGGSYKGHIYAQNDEFTKEKSGWLGFCGGQLYFRRNSKRSSDHLHSVKMDTLTIKSISPLNMPPNREGSQFVLFSDEDSLNAICTNRDDTLVVKHLNSFQVKSHYGNDVSSAVFELPLQLARKKFRTLGYAAFEDEVLNQNQIQKIQSSYNIFEPKLPNNADVKDIACGKEFGLVRSANGKVYYYGKPASLGLKSVGRTPSMKMTELIVSKISNVAHVAVGHDGVHALLVNDDGTVYFAGTARRGEDGDSSKNRRQPKSVKPKKMSKIEGYVIVHAACNNGTSAFVTKTGKLIMYGKDTAHCDAMGFVTDFSEQHITKVALGKAHCVVVNTKGQLFTFGLNNKGQCGRVFNKSKDIASTVLSNITTSSNSASSTLAPDVPCDKNATTSSQAFKKIKYDFTNLCDYDDHTMFQGQCRVCVVCRECTGYNVSCVSTMNVSLEERVGGAICPCGHGDAGCSKCGLCSSCIRIQENEHAESKETTKTLVNELCRQRSKTLIMRRKDKKYTEDNSSTTTALETSDATGSSELPFEKDPPRVAPLAPQMLVLATTSPVVQVACGLHHTVVLTLAGDVFTFGSNQYGQLGTDDLAAVSGPHKVQLPAGATIIQVAAGSNHTVLLTEKGVVYTFGSYQKGQLGRLPNEMQQQSLSTHRGSQTTSKGFLGYGGSSRNNTPASTVTSLHDATIITNNLIIQRQKYLWNCSLGAVFGLGPSFGKRASWIGASGDQTFIKIDESLITSQMLSKINVVANKNTILLIPTIPLTFNILTINRRDGSCTAHSKQQVNFVQLTQNDNKIPALPEINRNSVLVPTLTAGPITDQMSRSMHEARNQIFDLQEQHQFAHGEQPQKRRMRKVEEACSSSTDNLLVDHQQPQIAFALDSVYNVLWVYDGIQKKLLCYNVLCSEVDENATNTKIFHSILSSELSLPNTSQARVHRSQASLNLLACLDILTSAHDSIPGCFDEVLMKPHLQIKEPLHDDYQIVNRFENFGGGWGYSGHSVEALRFSADAEVMICGFGMFGGRGEYTCKLKLYDLGNEGGGYEKEGILISETKEVPYECAARSKHHVMLPKPVTAVAGRWYLVWARIAGPSSDCGSCGQPTVTTEDQITFTFKSSKKANNGTDVNSGQIPAVLYRLITQELKQPISAADLDPVQKVSKKFANSVSRECFESLVVLLQWSWDMFKTNLREQRSKSNQLEVRQSLSYLSYVTKFCLRLLRKYTNEIYPHRVAINNSTSVIPLKFNTTTSKTPASKSAKINNCNEPKDKNNKGLVDVSNCVTISTSSPNNKYLNETGPIPGPNTPITRKPNLEEIQLAESIGNVRALLIGIFCDNISKDICTDEGYTMTMEILDECHNSFVACFHAFYPTSSLKWNCLCDLLAQMDKGTLHARLLSAILAGLCSPAVKLRTTFSLMTTCNERQSIVSPSDNSGLPMLSSTDAHQYPILVEQMIYRTQQEKQDFLSNSWTFKDVLIRLLDIIANPVRTKIEQMAYRNLNKYPFPLNNTSKDTHQGLIDNCSHLLARVLAEVVFQTSLGDFDKMFLPPRTLHSTGSRFARCDISRTWNTGNFGSDAVAFSVDRPGIAIAGAMVYAGSGSYEYQLELLYDNTVDLQSQNKWEALESISGTYLQEAARNDMVEIKFERAVHIKENARYAIRLCSQGARTCSGDAGMPSIRGPCGTTFYFYACDLSFNGTSPKRGQIPCILYYSSSIKDESTVNAGASGNSGPAATSTYGGNYESGSNVSETTTRDTALQITADITKKCTELLTLARNCLAASLSPSDNSSNHTQTVDSEHNITPIEEHMDINWTNKTRSSALPVESNISTARDLTKRIESFSKGIIETLKFDKISTNPFEMEIEIGATEIYPKDLMNEANVGVHDLNYRNGQMAKLNGNVGLNEENLNEEQPAYFIHSEDSEELTAKMSVPDMLAIFNMTSANLFHTLLPLVYAHIANLACCDPKSSVHILGLIKDILPHIAALNQLYNNKNQQQIGESTVGRLRHAMAENRSDGSNTAVQCTTSNHYCVVESEHPYRSASITSYRVDFPACVQWLTVEFDPQCGTAQLEDYLLVSIPMRPKISKPRKCDAHDDYNQRVDNNNLRPARQSAGCKFVTTLKSCHTTNAKDDSEDIESLESDWMVVKKFNTNGNWMQNVMILPGNCIEFSLETSSLYVQDPHSNRFGFKCLIVGFDNPVAIEFQNSSLMSLEQELAYLGGMCSSNLMKRDINLPDDKEIEDLSGVEETISTHHALLSKGFALSESLLTVHQALESSLPIGSQSNERQFLKDFISNAPASSGARLAAWLQPESRLDPNKCELNAITEPLRYGWPSPITVTIRDQYGDAVLVPDLKVEIKAIPTGATGNGNNVKLRRTEHTLQNCANQVPRFSYEPTIRDKMCFKAITFMKPFSNYSFEELRFNSPMQTRTTEILFAQDMEDGTFSVHWTPNSVGQYCLTVNIDGITLEEIYRVEVKEGGLPPPTNKHRKSQPPSKLRKFHAANTSGLRIRSHPTLQSEQVGVIKLNGIISFIDEVLNDDGIWLRLSTESIRQHCTTGWYPTEAWCLQFNQHTAKTLLHPVESSETASETVKTIAKPKHKKLLENIDGCVSPSPDSAKATKSVSPSKNHFDFSQARFSPKSTTSQSGSSTNPFLLPETSTLKPDEEHEVDLSGSFDICSSTSIEASTTASSSSCQTRPRSSSPSNIGSAIAGVVGGGASKLQALQKWFKGDSVEGSVAVKPEKEHYKRPDAAILHNNGNNSNPIQIPKRGNVTDSTSTSNSSNSSSKEDFKEDGYTVELAQQASENFDVSTLRRTNFTAKQTAALLSTPKHSPRKFSMNQRNNSSDDSRESNKSNLVDDLSVLQITTTTTNATKSAANIPAKQEPILLGGDTKHLSALKSNKKRKMIGPIKCAMPPSLAESIRAVFAAFLWHEGLVHDAMTCASFLKFHPMLPKEGATVVTRRDHSDEKWQLSREQKAQQRHSVEVANAGNYLNIRPSTLETLTKSGNSSINNRKYRKNLSSNSGGSGTSADGEQKQKLHLLPEVVTVLPPALRCLVYLWENICAHSIEVVQNNSLERQKCPTPSRDLNGDLSRDNKFASDSGVLNNDRETKKSRKKKKEDSSWCEICELFLTIPVTYHMRLEHPGCGKAAKGKGYNSVGVFCEGWAGNCGEGGKGASSWYLMCDICREKYVSLKNSNMEDVNEGNNIINTNNEISLFGGKNASLIANAEVYTTMRENASFLLELCSNNSNLPAALANGGTSTIATRSPQQMPVVTENEYFTTNDLNNKPSTSRCGSARNSRFGLRMMAPSKCNAGHRKSIVCNPCGVLNTWTVPDSFAYLECLGAMDNEDNMPYEMFGHQNTDSGYERPLSEISYESCESHNYEIMAGSMGANARQSTGLTTLNKFHRSYSMGQGWTLANELQEEEYYKNQQQSQCVMQAKRNNANNEGDGALLMCYPSENLRKLVPEHVLNTTVVCAKVEKIQTTNVNADVGVSNSEPPLDAEAKSQLAMLINRPVMCFIMQKHELIKLRYAMKRSLRIATCRIYALQAINWLLRSVTQSVCLHDLMWWFVNSLRTTSSFELMDVKYEDHEHALEHPVSFTQISGRFSHMITLSLHIFLQSVADLTLYLPLGSALQRAAIQCFGIRFRHADHQFLHTSHVFGNISKILSKSDEQNDALAVSGKLQANVAETSLGMHDVEHNFQTIAEYSADSGSGARMLYYSDMQGMFELSVSSRQAMAESLTDNSTETFWESDEEDRNKCKIIEISLIKYTYVCRMVYVHIDNSRDIQNKVLNIVFYAGQSLGETNLIKTVDVDQNACTWIAAKITDDSFTHFRLEFHGPENTLRVRQIKLFGLPRTLSDLDTQLPESHDYASSFKANLKLTHACRIQQQLCEAETLRVFRLITGQVFGKLISTTVAHETQHRPADSRHQSAVTSNDCSTNSLLADSLDLREHMVGILFSRSKLSHLQKQVIVHIVHAIRKEAQRAREDWEIVNLTNCFKDTQVTSTTAGDNRSESSSEHSPALDTYCFEMLSMVLALSGSVVGRSYLSQQHGLLKDLFTLLHTGSDRVQRQVTSLLRRILPEITPELFAELMGVPRLPPTDYIAHQAASDFDMNRLGLLDTFLAIIAKSLQLQIKTKTHNKPGVEKFPAFIRLCNSLDLSVHTLLQSAKSTSAESETTKHEDTNFGFDHVGTEDRYSLDNAFNNFRQSQSTRKWTGKHEDGKKNLNQRWFLNGTISMKQAESIIALIRDLAHGKLGERWSQMTKAAIAEAVLNLTRLDVILRSPENCIKTASLWLALASLCVLDRDHVEKLSSGQWSKTSDTRPMCTNHDDGETPAVIQCETCGDLCGDCDRFLHLNRKTRLHKRTVCKEEEEAIRVELHESCGRTKLFWLLALADSKTLKAMVEFRDGSHTIISGPQEAVGRCRFCGITGNSGLLEIGNVCADAQCQTHAANACMKTKPCGHACGGVANEQKCLPCLQHVCHARENELAEGLHEPKLTQDADDMCMICFVEALSCAPSIHLLCGHVFHYHCSKTVLEKRWNGPRITFGFSLCPICKADIQHPLLLDILEPINALKEDVKRKALMRLKYEGLVKEPEVRDAQQAMERYAYYVCFKCQKAYYGGEARCDAEIGEKFDPSELVCGGCSDVARAQMCPKHGTDFLEYKCRYCCSVAVFFCFGTTHFCDTCHDDFQRLTNIPKNKLPQCPAGPKAKQLIGDECPLHVMHPQTGEEFALGCGLCRNAQTF